MTRVFLIGSFLILSFSSLSLADTLVDVFDDSLESQIMQISASEIEEALGADTVTILAEVAKEHKPKFLLASFPVNGKSDQNSTYNHWTAGNYPVGMVGTDAFFTPEPDENFLYFAADLAKSGEKTETFGFKNFSKSLGDHRADHYLEKLPGNLSGSTNR